MLISFWISGGNSGQVFRWDFWSGQPSKILGGRLDHPPNQEVLGSMAVCGRLRRQQASGRRDQGPSARALSEVRASRPVQNDSLARAFCARRASGIPPIYGCVRPRLEGTAWSLRIRKKMLPSARWVVFVSFSPFRTATVNLPHRAKNGMFAAHDLPRHTLLDSCARCCAPSTAQK